MRRLSKKTLIMLGFALAYMLVLVLFGSPLLALSTWMGWVDPQAVR